MFPKEVYIKRRNDLKKIIGKGLILLPGNHDVAFNYPANIYSFRQDSTFIYFFGINHPDYYGIIDIDNNKDYIFADDIDIDDIIWTGKLPTVKDYASQVGVENTKPVEKINETVQNAIKDGREVHFLPPYRAEIKIFFQEVLNIPIKELKENSSEALIKAVVKLASVKDKYEIEEIERTVDVAYEMHTTAMKMAKPGVVEQEIAGKIEGIAISHGGPVSFPVILSVNGQILHNHSHNNILKEGDLMVCDAGAESPMSYTSDITRTVPVGGKFSPRQKEIYEIVLKANLEVIKMIKPGIFYKEVHLHAAKVIADGLKAAGLMKGDMDEAVKQGAHALFFPHGLGHMMGLDVHDMEGLGEDYVGYDETVKRSEQFGIAFLRLAKKLKPGFVLTDEPGIYFIPELIDIWKKENKFTEFINYDKVETYKDFGGIRIEDDILVTETGCRVLGKPIPKTVDEIEEIMK